MALQRQIERRIAEQPNKPHAFLLFDIDNFKNINDTLGHSMGDTVLKVISALISCHFRTADITGRMGGDEFAVFLSEIHSPSMALRRAGELKQTITNVFKSDPSLPAVTVSIGLSLYPYEGTDFQTLYQCADKALYEVKRKGGNGYYLQPA